MVEAMRDRQALFLGGIIDNDAAAEGLIVDDNRVGAAKRLAIYRNNYRSSLTGVLADHYERLHAYLGDEQFDNLAEAYVDGHKSRTRNLRYYGEAFPAFLAQHYPCDGELAELAALDWALRRAFDAADTPPLDAARVGELGDAWIEQRLALHPSATLLPVRHNVAALWSSLDAEEEPPEVEELGGVEMLLVWRFVCQSRFRSLGGEEEGALALLAAGASFTDLSAALIEAQGEAAAMESLAAWLGAWLSDELLVVAD